MSVNCGQTVTPTTDETPLPCDDFRSTRCTVHEEAIAYLGLSANTPLDVVVDTLMLSLIDARNRVTTIEAELLTVIKNDLTTAYTIVLADVDDTITLSNAAAVTVTIPTNVTAAIPVNSKIIILNKGVGVVTIAGDVGVTLEQGIGGLTLNQWESRTLRKIETDTWVLSY